MKRFLFFGLLALSSCKVFEPQKGQVLQTTVRDSTIVKTVVDTIKVKGSTVAESDVQKLYAQMRKEQAAKITAQNPTPQVIVRTVKDDNGVELRFMLDAMGRFQADCSKRDATILRLQKQIEFYRTKEIVRAPDKPSKFSELLKSVGIRMEYLLYGVIAVLFLLIFGACFLRN